MNSPVIEFFLSRLYPAPKLKLPLTPVYAPVGFSGAEIPPPMLRARRLCPCSGIIQPAPSKLIVNTIFFDIDLLLSVIRCTVSTVPSAPDRANPHQVYLAPAR